MGMGGGGDAKAVRSDINITPLVDVLLVLLIIFMVISPVLLKALEATIPRKDDADVSQDIQAQQIVVKVGPAPDNAIQVNDTPTSVDDLQKVVGDKVRSSRERIVFFSPDDASGWGTVAHYMDLVRGCHRDAAGNLDVKIGIMTSH